MSPRAACRLEALGFQEVYDYELGIADWRAAGLPVEGDGPVIQTAADAMRPDVPTCSPDEVVAEIRNRIAETDWSDCVVLDCHDKVVGRLRESHLTGDGYLTAGQVMQAGPSTVRPSDPLERLVRRMDRRPTPLVVVTTPQGQLLGVVLREEAKRILSGEPAALVWADCEGCPGQWRPS